MSASSLPSPENNLASLLAQQAGREAPALTWAGGSINYAQLAASAAGARAYLEANGIGPGDRLALALPNVPQMVSLYYGALALGAVVVPLHPLLSAREASFQLENSGARLLLAWEGSRVAQELAADRSPCPLELVTHSSSYGSISGPWEATAVHPQDPAVIIHTSGTTGTPKGATLTHRNLLSNARTCVDFFGFTGQDVMFGGLPLFHAFGQTISMNSMIAAGASIALLPRFTPGGAAQLSVSAGVTLFAAVPSMYQALASYLETDLALAGQLVGQVRFGISGGSALPESVHRAMGELAGFSVYEGYGLSETSPVVSFNRAESGLVLGSVGKALPGVQVQVVDAQGQELEAGQLGELRVAGENVMAGYWQNPEATEAVMEGPWLATGDLARLDEEGNIFILDRIKDMILRNGHSIYPREIEILLDGHPAISQLAVVGLPSQTVGEEVVAVLVARQPLEEADKEEVVRQLDAQAQAGLASYKYPRRYLWADELPLGPSGKVLKRQLVEELS